MTFNLIKNYISMEIFILKNKGEAGWVSGWIHSTRGYPTGYKMARIISQKSTQNREELQTYYQQSVGIDHK